MWAPLSIVLSQSTRLTDGRTDGQKGHVCCITCSRAVKKREHYQRNGIHYSGMTL